MAGCGKVYNGQHKVEGSPLTCEMKLFWRLPGTKLSDKARRCEAVLCSDCQEETDESVEQDIPER